KSLGTTNLVHTYIDVPPRAAILARDGTPLAITANVGVVGTSRALMNSPQVKDKPGTINALAQKLGLNAADVQKKIDDPSTPEDYHAGRSGHRAARAAPRHTARRSGHDDRRQGAERGDGGALERRPRRQPGNARPDRQQRAGHRLVAVLRPQLVRAGPHGRGG